MLQAREVMEHFQQVGEWVDWDNTCDQFLYGSPDETVNGIAVAWIATNKCIKTAAERGLNLFITHEPIFCEGYSPTETGKKVRSEKKRLLDQLGITVMRCHDTWDRMPGVGIVDAWGEYLGFDCEDRPVESFYRLCCTHGETVAAIGRRVLDKVRSLGQDTVLVFGDQYMKVEKMAIGTGAITHLPSMYHLGADLILATDDGMTFWDGGLWARDLGVPLLIVNHCTSEKPGMMAMAPYLKGRFPGVRVEYLDVDFPYESIRG